MEEVTDINGYNNFIDDEIEIYYILIIFLLKRR